jgi:hypothetical protein
MEAELFQATTPAERLTNPTENEPTVKTEREQRALDQELRPAGNGDSTRNLIEHLMPDLKAHARRLSKKSVRCTDEDEPPSWTSGRQQLRPVSQ